MCGLVTARSLSDERFMSAASLTKRVTGDAEFDESVAHGTIRTHEHLGFTYTAGRIIFFHAGATGAAAHRGSHVV